MNASRPPRPSTGPRAWWAGPWWQLVLILAACGTVYWVGLGWGGLHSTEGHRVIPGREILRTGDWLVTSMFGQPYLRKPPGMPWAIAVSTWLFGPSVWSARAVSALAATAMALVAWRSTRAWFGPAGGLAAGLASALLPWFWESGRAAEIEALNTLGAQLAALPLLTLLLRRPGHGVASARSARSAMLVAAIGVALAGLAKGPALLPLLLGVLGAGAIVAGPRAALSARVWVPLLAGGAAVGAVYAAIWWRVAARDLSPVTQSPSAFAFEPGALLRVAMLPAAAFVASMPASLAVVFPWGPNAAKERTTRAGRPTPRLRFARALAWAWVLTLAVSMVFGLSNVRYTLPAAVLLPPLVGYVVATHRRGMTPPRAAIARAMLLGRAWAWAPVLLIGAAVYVATVEAGRRSSSGRDAGRAIAARLLELAPERPLTIAADQAIEARPETLLSARAALERAWGEPGVRVRWVPGLSGPVSRASGTTAYLLRWDGRVSERWAAERVGVDDPERAEWTGIVHDYRFVLCLGEPPENEARENADAAPARPPPGGVHAIFTKLPGGSRAWGVVPQP